MRALAWASFADSPHGARRRLVELDDDGAPGRPIALRGFNVSGAAKRIGRPFSAETDVVQRAQTFLPRLAADGFDLLRVPVIWEFLQPSGPADWQEPTARALRSFVEYAADAGFRVIVDIHQDVVSSYFRDRTRREWRGDGLPAWVVRAAYAPDAGAQVPQAWVDRIPFLSFLSPRVWAFNYEFNAAVGRCMSGWSRPEVLAAFQQFGARLAGLFAGLRNILAYEVIKEPYSKWLSPEAHLALGQAVRRGLGDAVAPGRTPTCTFVPAGDWLDTPSRFTQPFPRLDVERASILSRASLPDGVLHAAMGDCWAITPHFYDVRADPPCSRPETSRYEAAVAAAEELVERRWQVVPVVGEFGCSAATAAREQCHAAWIDAFVRRGWSWCLWNFNPDAGPGGDDHWCGERFSLAEHGVGAAPTFTSAYEALLRPFPKRYGAPLLASAWEGGRWHARLGRAFRPGWTTEIHVPATLGPFEARGGAARDRTVVVEGTDGEHEVAITLACAGSGSVRGA